MMTPREFSHLLMQRQKKMTLSRNKNVTPVGFLGPKKVFSWVYWNNLFDDHGFWISSKGIEIKGSKCML